MALSPRQGIHDHQDVQAFTWLLEAAPGPGLKYKAALLNLDNALARCRFGPSRCTRSGKYRRMCNADGAPLKKIFFFPHFWFEFDQPSMLNSATQAAVPSQALAKTAYSTAGNSNANGL